MAESCSTALIGFNWLLPKKLMSRQKDIQKSLNVVSTKFLLVCFLSLNGSTCETSKMLFISL